MTGTFPCHQSIGRAARYFGVSLFIACALGVAHALPAAAASGPCTAPATDYGTVTASVTIPSGTATATYQVWSRMAATDSTNDTYLLEVDGPTTECFTVGGSSAKAVATYTSTEDANGTRFNNDSSNWINTTTGGSRVTVSLPAGATSIKLIGNAPGVVLDRVIFTQDASCTPTGTGDNGDNCVSTAPADTPPVGSITSPADGASVSNPDVAVLATDDTAVTKVDIYDGTTKLGSAALTSGSSASGTWKYSWDTSALAAGSSHTLTAKLSDGTNSLVTTAAVDVTIKDISPPTGVAITSPTANSIKTAAFTAIASATDDVAVTKVEFYVSGTLAATATTAPYTKQIPVTGLTAGNSYTLTAKAYDAAGHTTTSPGISFTYSPATSAAAPGVSISNLSASTIVSTDITIVAGQNNAELTSAAYIVNVVPDDNSGTGIKQVTLQLDSKPTLSLTSGFDFAVDMRNLSCGTHTLLAVVTDNQTVPKTGTTTVTFKATRGVDINGNCTVDLADYNAVRSNYGVSANQLSNPRIDVNRNGAVDLSDYSGVRTKYGT